MAKSQRNSGDEMKQESLNDLLASDATAPNPPQLEIARNMNKLKGLSKKLKLVESIGILISIIGSISYLIVIIVLIRGANDLVVETSVLVVYVLLNAVFGIVIGYGLALQGVIWGKVEHREILREFYNHQAKEQKTGTMMQYWIGWWMRSIVVKALMAILMMTGVVMLGFSGIHDISYFLLALANLVMFFGFGLLGLVGGYNYVNERFIPYAIQYLDSLTLKLNVGQSSHNKG